MRRDSSPPDAALSDRPRRFAGVRGEEELARSAPVGWKGRRDVGVSATVESRLPEGQGCELGFDRRTEARRSIRPPLGEMRAARRVRRSRRGELALGRVDLVVEVVDRGELALGPRRGSSTRPPP